MGTVLFLNNSYKWFLPHIHINIPNSIRAKIFTFAYGLNYEQTEMDQNAGLKQFKD